jgi:hypothetical protein
MLSKSILKEKLSSTESLRLWIVEVLDKDAKDKGITSPQLDLLCQEVEVLATDLALALEDVLREFLYEEEMEG